MPNGYTILAANQSQEIVPGSGALRDVMEVTYETDRGGTGTVRVPMTGDYITAATEAIAQRVADENRLYGG